MPCSAASAWRARRASTSRARPPAPRPWRPPCARPRARRRREAAGEPPAAREQRAEVVARPHLGQRRAARRPRLTGRSAREALEHGARARRAAGPLVERGAQRGEVARRVDVELERGACATRTIAPPARAARRGGPASPARRRARAPSGGVEQQRVGARAVAVGHDHHAGSVRRASRRVDLARVQGRAVAGHEQRPLGAALHGRLDADLGGRRLAGLDGVGTTCAPARSRASAAARSSAVTTITSSSPSTAPARRARPRPSRRPARAARGRRPPRRGAAWRCRTA